MKTEKPLISVIIPVYNGEKFIESCVNSVVCQTYPNIEILILEDNSSDGSLAICNSLAEKHSNIRVIPLEHCGVSAARNKGIELAKGEYIAFIDCDDTVQPELYSKMQEAMERDGSDMALDGRTFCDEHSNVIRREGYNVAPGKYSGEDIDKYFILPLISNGAASPFTRPVNNGSCCICLYKKELLRGIEFLDEKELAVAEDLIFQLYALKNVRSVSKIEGYYYLYYYPIAEASRSKNPGEKIFDRRIAVLPFIEQFAAKYPNIKNTDEYIAADYIFTVTHSLFCDVPLCATKSESLQLIRRYLNTKNLAQSVKKIKGKQHGIKDKLFMSALEHKTAVFLLLYIEGKKIIKNFLKH